MVAVAGADLNIFNANCDAHMQYMRDFAARLEGTGELVDSQALSWLSQVLRGQYPYYGWRRESAMRLARVARPSGYSR